MAFAPTKTGDRGAAPDLAHFRRRYPLTVASFGALHAREAWLRRVWEADERFRAALAGEGAGREAVARGAPPAGPERAGEFEVIYAGAGVGLLHAAAAACVAGRRVMVFAEGEIGRSERGWNVSDEELSALAGAGLFTRDELESFVVNRYRTGRVKFHDAASRVKAPPLEVAGVLDVALDADRLLAAAAARLRSRAGCALVERARFVRAHVEPHRVSVELEDARGERRLYGARLFVDASGPDSAAARQLNGGRAFTHVRPTVGAVARGFARGEGPGRVDFRVGDLMVSTEDAGAHRQLIWEGFAGDARRDEFTACLFFYDAADSPADKSLLALYEQYFEKLPAYKRGGAQWRVLRPVFGHGGASSERGARRRPRRAAAEERVLLAGEAAPRVNPLGFAGPGAHLRELPRLARLIERALACDALDARSLSEITAGGVRAAADASHLAEFLRPARAHHPGSVNETLNAVMAALGDLDERVRRELFQDRLSFAAFRSLFARTFRLYPRILQRVREHLGARGTLDWLAHAAEAAFTERRAARSTSGPGADAPAIPEGIAGAPSGMGGAASPSDDDPRRS